MKYIENKTQNFDSLWLSWLTQIHIKYHFIYFTIQSVL
jgi:hypothetical protein